MTTLTHNTAIDADEQDAKAQMLAQFEKEGYVVIPGVIAPERIQEVRSLLAGKIGNKGAGAYERPSELQELIKLPVRPKGILMDLFVNCPELLDIVCNQSLADALTAILGDNFVMLPDSVAHWDCYNILHTDTTTAEQQGWMYHKEDDYRIVVVGFYLQDNLNGSGGGLYIVPGSHLTQDPFVKLRKELSGKLKKLEKSPLKRLLKKLSLNRLYNYDKPFLEHPQGFDLPSKAGDVLIFDMRMLHRSSFTENQRYAPEGGKMSIFVHASRNNRHAQNYVNYIKTKYDAYAHLHKSRNTAEQERRCAEYGFTAL